MNITTEELSSFYLGKVSEYLHAGTLLYYHNELKNDDELIREIEDSVKDVDSFQQKFESMYDFRFFRILLYALVRELRPSVVIETGVMHGLSSKFILRALKKNGDGKLISIDLPSYFETGPVNQDGYNYTLPKGKEPGWIIADQDKKFWDLRLGKSLELLPEILRDNKIDIFIHDSEHTYHTMWNELNMAWEHLRDNGLVICDNIESNSSFFDFCRKVMRTPMLLPVPGNEASQQVRFAVIRK